MFVLLARLRQRPEKDRRRIAFLAAVFITITIVLMWLASVLIVRRDAVAAKPVKTQDSPTTSVWKQLKSGAGSFIGALSD